VRADAPENPVFNLLDVGLIVLVTAAAFFFCTIVAVVVMLATHSFHQSDLRNPAVAVLLAVPIQVATYIVSIGFMVLYIWLKYRKNFLEAVRWNMPMAKFAWLALAGGAGLAIAIDLVSIPLHRWIPKSLPIEQFFGTPASAYTLAAFGILVAPLVEELFFRGFLYPALARPLGVVPAIALTAAGFALVHAEQLAHAWVPLALLFGVGTLLTTVRAKTNSVAICVLIHMGYNFTLFTLLFIGTDGFRHMEKMQ
jgi:membrane protease YdiL (CAAX protease family)